MTSSVPAELTGLWRRERITTPDLSDETTSVFWLQTGSWYVDLRVPADRPLAAGREGLAGFSDGELLALARVEGFAGELRVEAGICAWRRDFDHQPPAPTPDEGRYRLDGEVMIEDGIHIPYREIWRRQPASASPLLAFALQDDPGGRRGLLVAGGGHLLEFVARPGPPLTHGASLSERVGDALAAGDRAAAEALLGSRIRYATCEAGAWITRLSAEPWREDRPFWSTARFDPASGLLEVEGPSARWKLIDAHGDPGSLTNPS